MKRLLSLFALTTLITIPVLAQGRGDRHSVGGGHVPAHGPAAVHGNPRAPRPEAHPSYSDRNGHPNAPHVHADDRWVGHDM